MISKVAVTGSLPLPFQSGKPAHWMRPGHPPMVVHTDSSSVMGLSGRDSGTVRITSPFTKNRT